MDKGGNITSIAMFSTWLFFYQFNWSPNMKPSWYSLSKIGISPVSALSAASPSHWICSSASCNLSRLGCNRLLGKVGPIGCESQRSIQRNLWLFLGLGSVGPPVLTILQNMEHFPDQWIRCLSYGIKTIKNLQNRWLDQFHNMNFHGRMQPAQPRCSQNGSHLLSLSLMSWVQLMLGNATYLMNMIWVCLKIW